MSNVNRKLTENVSVSLPKDMKKRVEKFADEQDLTFSQVVKQALRGYLVKQELDEIQNFMRPAFQKLGINTDEDVEKYFS